MEKLKKEELIKSMQELEFSEEEIQAVIQKAEDEDKLETSDKEVVDDAEDYDKEEVKKAYDAVMSAKASFDASLASFLDRFGKVPGLKTPTDDVANKSETEDIEKSEETEEKVDDIKKGEDVEKDKIEKSEDDDIQKAFTERTDTLEKSMINLFEDQNKTNETILKSIESINEKVDQIAAAPNPLKSILGNYGILEKAESGDGKDVFSLSNKNATNALFEKSLDKIENEQDKQVVRDMISSYTISNKTNPRGLDIVKKALNIDFEK